MAKWSKSSMMREDCAPTRRYDLLTLIDKNSIPVFTLENVTNITALVAESYHILGYSGY